MEEKFVSLYNEIDEEKREIKRIINFLENVILHSEDWKVALLSGVSVFRDLSNLRETHLKMIELQKDLIKDLQEENIKILNEIIEKQT